MFQGDHGDDGSGGGNGTKRQIVSFRYAHGMVNAGVRRGCDLVSGIDEPEQEDVLFAGVEECAAAEAFVEPSKLLQGRSADEEIRPETQASKLRHAEPVGCLAIHGAIAGVELVG